MRKLFSSAFVYSINKTLAFRNYSISKAKHILTREENGILNAALILMVLVVVTKFTGLIFNSMAAGYLGAGPYNEFLFASNIPEIISASILLGAISASVIPALIESREEGGHVRFLRALNTLVNASLLVFSILALLIAVSAQWVVPWSLENLVRPVTPPTPEEIDEIVMMLRVLMIPQVILGISTFVSSALNVMQRFVVPQLAPLFYNFGRITAIFVFIPFLGRSPWVLVWGTILGSLAHLLIQIPLTRHLNIKYMPVLDLQDKYFRSMIKLGLPRILGLSAEEIAIGVDRVIAYSLIDYSLTAYELAIRLIVIPMSLFGLTFSIASFPALSRAYIQKNDELFSSIFIRILNQIFFMALPVTVMLLVLRLPITRLFYGILGSNFTWDDTRKVAWVVMFFAVGLTFESIRSFLYKTFYAIHDSRTPLFAAIFVVVGGIVTGILFTNYFSHFDELSVAHLTFNVDYFFDRSNGKAAVGGLALSSSLIYTIESISLMFILNKKYLKLSVYKFVGPLLLKSAIASATAVLAYFLYTLYNDILDTTKTSQIILLTSTTVFASASFYLWLSFLLNVREVEMIEKLVAKIFRVIFRR